MKRLVTAIFVLSIVFAASSLAQNKFVGVKACACHKMDKVGNQVKVWEGTKHAKALDVLKSEKADAIAKEKGLTKSAAESPECLKCHTTGYDQPQEKNFVMDGVQCEACHGAASGYKSLHNKPENKEKAVAAGLVDGKDGEKICVKCHNSESPTFKEFNYKEMWEKIKHPKKG